MKKMLRGVAMVTLFCFLTTQCVSAAPGAGIEMIGQRELPAYLSIDVPAELGTVDALYEAPGSANPQFILHIQNAHANYQAQMKIKQLLGYMNKKYGFKTIFVEGASEQLDADYLRLFPDQERNIKLCDELAKQGELTGAELFLMEQSAGLVPRTSYLEQSKNESRVPSPELRGEAVEALGIEQASLYKANYDALKKVFGAEADVNRFFKGFDGKLDKVASKTFTPETRQLIADWKRFEQGRREFMPFVRNLTVKSKKILNVDLESLFAQVGWPQISRLLVIQQMEKEMDKAKGIAEQAALVKMLRTKGVSKELLATLENFTEGSIAVGKSTKEVSPREILENLAAEAGPKGFKFSDYPAFSLYAGYVTLRSELDPKVLFEEIEYLFTQMLDKLVEGTGTFSPAEKMSQSPQKALLSLYRDGELLRKLLHLELNRTQWRQLLANREQIAIPSLVARLKDAIQTGATRNGQRTTGTQGGATQGGNEKSLSVARSTLRSPVEATSDVMPPAFAKTMDSLFTAGLEFYDFAHQREAVFYKEMQSQMQEKKITKAILITGGFHTDGMSDLFRENAVSYGIVTPRLSEKSDENLYRKIMLQNEQVPFSISYLEAVSKLQPWMAQEKQGYVPAEDLKGILADIMKIAGVTLSGAVQIFNASDAARKVVYQGKTGIVLSISNPENGQPGYRIVPRADVTRIPLESATVGKNIKVELGQLLAGKPIFNDEAGTIPQEMIAAGRTESVMRIPAATFTPVTQATNLQPVTILPTRSEARGIEDLLSENVPFIDYEPSFPAMGRADRYFAAEPRRPYVAGDRGGLFYEGVPSVIRVKNAVPVFKHLFEKIRPNGFTNADAWMEEFIDSEGYQIVGPSLFFQVDKNGPWYMLGRAGQAGVGHMVLFNVNTATIVEENGLGENESETAVWLNGHTLKTFYPGNLEKNSYATVTLPTYQPVKAWLKGFFASSNIRRSWKDLTIGGNRESVAVRSETRSLAGPLVKVGLGLSVVYLGITFGIDAYRTLIGLPGVEMATNAVVSAAQNVPSQDVSFLEWLVYHPFALVSLTAALAFGVGLGIKSYTDRRAEQRSELRARSEVRGMPSYGDLLSATKMLKETFDGQQDTRNPNGTVAYDASNSVRNKIGIWITRKNPDGNYRLRGPAWDYYREHINDIQFDPFFVNLNHEKLFLKTNRYQNILKLKGVLPELAPGEGLRISRAIAEMFKKFVDVKEVKEELLRALDYSHKTDERAAPLAPYFIDIASLSSPAKELLYRLFVSTDGLESVSPVEPSPEEKREFAKAVLERMDKSGYPGEVELRRSFEKAIMQAIMYEDAVKYYFPKIGYEKRRSPVSDLMDVIAFNFEVEGKGLNLVLKLKDGMFQLKSPAAPRSETRGVKAILLAAAMGFVSVTAAIADTFTNVITSIGFNGPKVVMTYNLQHYGTNDWTITHVVIEGTTGLVPAVWNVLSSNNVPPTVYPANSDVPMYGQFLPGANQFFRTWIGAEPVQSVAPEGLTPDTMTPMTTGMAPVAASDEVMSVKQPVVLDTREAIEILINRLAAEQVGFDKKLSFDPVTNNNGVLGLAIKSSDGISADTIPVVNAKFSANGILYVLHLQGDILVITRVDPNLFPVNPPAGWRWDTPPNNLSLRELTKEAPDVAKVFGTSLARSEVREQEPFLVKRTTVAGFVTSTSALAYLLRAGALWGLTAPHFGPLFLAVFSAAPAIGAVYEQIILRLGWGDVSSRSSRTDFVDEDLLGISESRRSIQAKADFVARQRGALALTSMLASLVPTVWFMNILISVTAGTLTMAAVPVLFLLTLFGATTPIYSLLERVWPSIYKLFDSPQVQVADIRGSGMPVPTGTLVPIVPTSAPVVAPIQRAVATPSIPSAQSVAGISATPDVDALRREIAAGLQRLTEIGTRGETDANLVTKLTGDIASLSELEGQAGRVLYAPAYERKLRSFQPRSEARSVVEVRQALADQVEALLSPEEVAMIERARLGVNNDVIQKLESMGGIVGRLIVMMVAGKIMSMPEKPLPEEVSEVLMSIAGMTETQLAPWVSRVREMLNVQDGSGLSVDALEPGQGTSEDEVVSYLENLANPYQEKVLFWLAENAGDATLQADASRFVEHVKALVEKQGLQFDVRDGQGRVLRNRFDIKIISKRDAAKELHSFTQERLKQMGVMARNAKMDMARFFILSGTREMLGLFEGMDTMPSVMIERPYMANKPKLRGITNIVTAQLSQELTAKAGTLSERTYLQISGNRGQLDMQKLEAFMDQLWSQVRAELRIATAA